MLQEWRNAHANTSNWGYGITRVENNNRSKPSPGWVKNNTDATIFEETNSVGFESVVRGEMEEFLMARTCKYRGVLTPREAEALSLKEAVKWAAEKGLKLCGFETDSKLVIDAIHENSDMSPFHMIVNDSVSLFKHFDDVLACHVNRSADGVAYLLAKVNYSMSDLI